MKTSHLIATVGGTGHLKPASGTWGSAAGLVLAWGLHALGGPALLIAALVFVWFAGLWSVKAETLGKADHDPSEIVVDEVVGIWIAFLPVSIGAAHVGAPLTALWPGWAAAFLGFRLFDIWKPWLVGRADRRNDALGVMLDDVIAGIFTAILVIALAAFSHLVLMA
ncbi:Phosphatidylglycerophosphatase A [Pseudooceanicola marinus]|uniref:Phosphatidylglycerophosphatase A n=1 Tax=Pseudooceanicola marinus TaxID=396013 RepID=A0A1X6YL82_9RHOB|nr:phosphatidylglycerophosphatase A [Pseudooceanicola marinus]PJE29304.1 phosphatidylglycerophosphatase A [Pseudooceanicola marinus]SLN24103.1 Phosphatidylglycerophosphatase A [Pseudooceanicola marinus]